MKIHRVDQRSDEWMRLRAGRLTASDAAVIYTQPKKGQAESETRSKLVFRTALGRVTGKVQQNPFDTPSMQRGREMEVEALSSYEGRTGQLLSYVGFVESDELPIGCSPDGALLNDHDEFRGGVEIKCPDDTTHWKYLKDPSRLVAAYEIQVAHTLLVCGAPWWDLASYCPAFPARGQLVIVRLAAKGVPTGPWEGCAATQAYMVDLAAHELNVRQFLREVDAEEAAIRDLTEQKETT